jgi:hypothetical protein
MGERTTVSGHIQEPWYLPGSDRELRWLRASNGRVIRSLPKVALLNRGMFRHSPNAQSRAPHLTATNRGRIIHFGGSFSSLLSDWPDWQAEFEVLLRRLYWEHAAVVVVTEWAGTHCYVWRPTDHAWEEMASQPPIPVSAWTLETTPDPL